MNYHQHFLSTLEEIKKEKRYRVFRTLKRHVGELPIVEEQLPANQTRDLTAWCSNDYLGMSHNPTVLEAMHQALDLYGSGAGGTRNISGTHSEIVALESTLAAFIGKPAALVFTSGYVANETALSTLGNVIPDLCILSDAANHASMIAGIKAAKSERKVFKHNDLEDLERLLQQLPLERPKLIAFESVYSMNGQIAPMKEICELAEKYNALTYADETHAVGLYGPSGAGLSEHFGLTDKVDIIQGGLGKAIGVLGGFIAASAEIVDTVRSCGSGFIFTTTIPPSVAAGARRSIEVIRDTPSIRAKFWQRISMARAAFEEAEIPMIQGHSHILPVVIGDAGKCSEVARELMDTYSIYLQPINYPTVPRGTERLRVTPTAIHSEKEIAELAQALSQLLVRSNNATDDAITAASAAVEAV